VNGRAPGSEAGTRPGIRAVLLDIEGTLRWGGDLIPGAPRALSLLREMGLALRFLTNIDSRSPEHVRSGLLRMGLEIEEGEVFTPTVALDRFLQGAAPHSCFLLLSQELRRKFSHFAFADPAERPCGPEFVVVGDFRDSLSYEALNQAFRYLLGGAGLVALQAQPYFMGKDGPYLDTGAFVHLLEYATGRTPLVLGKPAAEFFGLALAAVRLEPGAAVMVGDDLATDVAGASAAGLRTVLVRTGKFNAADLAAAQSKPDHVIDSVAGLPDLIARSLLQA
jgi:HAD superfamily hydrolase (TIGR01458 family)